MNRAPRDERTRTALRFNALLAGSLGLVSTVLLFVATLPFPKSVAWFSLLSVCCYFAYFLAFDRICLHCYRGAGIALSQVGAAVVGVAVYYTGGVVSPLPFLYMAMLVLEAIYGLENPFTVPVSAAGYLFAVWGICLGFLPNPTPWAAAANGTPVYALVVSVLLVSYLFMTKDLSGLIISHLRARIESEAEQKDALVRKFAELNSTTQLGVLAHRIAHDLRGPIASISGYLEIEGLKKTTPQEKAEARAVGETLQAMVEMLHGITRFGKPGGPSAERIGLAGFMRDIAAIASFAPRAKGVRFEVTEEGAPPAETVASRADLQQAYFNIIKNAVEAVADNHDSKWVRITVKRAGRDVMVLVSDNGPGISEEALKNVFRRSVTTKKEGTGVGLMITRDLIVRNRGEIKMRNSAPGLIVETLLPLA